MTALDIFRECADCDATIERIQERIERRRALASGCTTRPLSPDGGSFGSGDASMRMLDYMADIQALEEELSKQNQLREVYRTCCFYLADLLSPIASSVALRTYLEHKGVKEISDEIRYSVSSVKRYRRKADDELMAIEILHWDHIHVPLYRLH